METMEYRETGELLTGRDMRLWTFNRGVIQLKISDIYYFESYQRKTVVHTRTKGYQIDTTLTEEVKKLPVWKFVQPHQGFLVHIDRILSMKDDALVLRNGVMIPVSRRNRKKVFERLRNLA